MNVRLNNTTWVYENAMSRGSKYCTVFWSVLIGLREETLTFEELEKLKRKSS